MLQTAVLQILNPHTNLAYMGLAKIIVAQDGSGSLHLKLPVSLSQYRGTVVLFNSGSQAKCLILPDNALQTKC